jgi:RNA polymerase sigma-70 factor
LPDPLDLQVQAIWTALVAEDGDLGVTLEAFCARVAAILDEVPPAERLGALDRLVLRDLHLVMACLAGNPQALRLFMRRFRPYLRHLSMRHAPSDALAEDIEAHLLATLFTPRHVDDPTSARLYSYQGKGTLQGWLRVTTRRMVIDALRRQRPASSEGEFDRLASPERGTEADLIHLEAAARLRPLFHGCLADLSQTERSLLSQYYRDGRVLREIGADLGIDTSSAFRRLGSVRDKVFKQFRRQARQTLGLTDGDLRGLLGALADDLNLDDLLSITLILFWPSA